MKKIHCYVLLLLLVGKVSFAQTTFVPDTNFRKFLIKNLPTYLDANNQIIDAKAATYSSTLDFSNLNIKDVTGLWKFHNAISVICINNEIENLDSLDKFSNLTFLYCVNNKISKLPSLSALSKFYYLSCGQNQLISLPDLSNNTPITYLDCSKNKISYIKGLGNLVNLQSAYLFSNRLDSLPDLSNLTKLQVLVCQENNLKSLRGLDKLTQLSKLVAGDNKFESLPDMSALTRLAEILLYNCQLTDVPNTSNMPNLHSLVLSDNKITKTTKPFVNPSLSILELQNNLLTKLSDISSTKNSLHTLKLHNNLLDSLPDLSTFTVLDTVYVQNNRLTFEDVIPLAQKTSIVNTKYAPQDSVGINQSFFVSENQTIKMVVGIDKKITNNKYTWYKNGKLYATTNTDTLLISKTQLADSGTYSCQVQNPLAPLLTLNSRTFTLKVKPCIDLSKLTYTTTDFDCNFGGKINIHDANISGGKKPYSYKLLSNETGFSRQSTTNVFTDLFEYVYTLEVKDDAGCNATYPKPILLKGKRGTDCKRLVILGNDNSPNNSLYLDEKGSAKIYDEDGQLIQTLTTPYYWDGKNKYGEFVPGFYIIDLNGKILNVTLIK